MTQITPTDIPDVLILTPRAFGDDRGSFMEPFRLGTFQEALAASGKEAAIDFVQDNFSVSTQAGTVRGLHYQDPPFAQGKLVRCVHGSIFDVAVDFRKDSPTFGRHVGVTLSAENRQQLWVPAGFLHGFATQTDGAQVAYKCTQYYSHAHDRNCAWNDSDLGIDWQLGALAPVLSAKDEAAPAFKAIQSPF